MPWKVDRTGGEAEFLPVHLDGRESQSAAGGDCHDISHPGDQAAGGDAELGIEMGEASGTGGEFTGIEIVPGLANSLACLDEFGLPVAHRFEGIEVVIELLFFSSGELGLHTADVLREEVEDVGAGIEGFAGVAGRGAGEEALIGEEGLALGGEGLASVPGVDVVNDAVVSAARDPESDVREDAGMGFGEGGIDRFAEDVMALRVATEGAEVGRVGGRSGDAARETMEEGEAVFEGLEWFDGAGKGVAFEGEVF